MSDETKDPYDLVKQKIPSNNPISILVDGLLQIPITQLHKQNFDAHEEAEQELDAWLEDFHDVIPNLKVQQVEHIAERAEKAIELLKEKRQYLAQECGHDDEEKDIKRRFARKIEELKQTTEETESEEDPVPEFFPKEFSPTTTDLQDDEDEEETDSSSIENDPTPYLEYTPNSNPHASNAFIFIIAILFLIAMLLFLPNFLKIIWGNSRHLQETQQRIDSPPMIPKVAEVNLHEQKHETETISVPEKNIALKEIRINYKEKLFRKKPKAPYVSFNDYLKKQKKLAKKDAKKKQKKNKRLVGNATLNIGRESHTIGSLIVDMFGCSYKVIKANDPRQQTEYGDNRESSIFEALKEHRLKKHPTVQCPNDRRIVD